MKINKLVALTVASALLLASMPMAVSAENDEIVYVKMNIPYAEFYAADVQNSVEVDAVTSATDTKWQKFDTAAYSVATETGGSILGVRFPVAMSKETYESLSVKESNSDDYYFEVLQETPAVYKSLTVENGIYNFSAVLGNTVVCGDDVTYTFTDSSRWGDYQLNLENTSFGTVYGVVVTTDNGTQYGLRHLENIWLKNYEYAWSAGAITTEPHGNTLSYEHYESIMGSTITNVTVIADDAVYSISTDQYVTVKTGNSVTVYDTSIDADSTTLEFADVLPADFEPVYTVDGLNMTCDGRNIYFDNASAGSYTFVVSDSNGKYADITTTFTLSTDSLTVSYDSTNKALIPAEGYTENDLATYCANITAVTVNDRTYAASGKMSTKIINSDGTINMDAVSKDEAVFSADITTFEIAVSATGYPDLIFTLSTAVVEESSEESSEMSKEESSETDNSNVENSTSTESPTTSDYTNLSVMALIMLAAVSVMSIFTAFKTRKSK